VFTAIETETDRVQWAAAGTNVTLYLTEIDPIHLDTGRVLCPQTHPVELASAFTARIIVFDIQVPILAGTSVSDRRGGRLLACLTQVVDRAFPSFS
jgi:elongation factor 1 alpha-like protein